MSVYDYDLEGQEARAEAAEKRVAELEQGIKRLSELTRKQNDVIALRGKRIAELERALDLCNTATVALAGERDEAREALKVGLELSREATSLYLRIRKDRPYGEMEPLRHWYNKFGPMARKVLGK